MRLQTVVALCSLTAIGILSAACDSFVGFTVENRANQDIIAWLLYADCDEVVGKRGEYDYHLRISAHSSEEVSDVTGSMPAEPYCVQATTLDRALVLSEAYEEGKTYVVREPLTLGVQIPDESGLPDRSFSERLSEERGLFVSVLASLLFGLPMATALLFGIFVTLRHFYRSYVSKPPA